MITIHPIWNWEHPSADLHQHLLLQTACMQERTKMDRKTGRIHNELSPFNSGFQFNRAKLSSLVFEPTALKPGAQGVKILFG